MKRLKTGDQPEFQRGEPARVSWTHALRHVDYASGKRQPVHDRWPTASNAMCGPRPREGVLAGSAQHRVVTRFELVSDRLHEAITHTNDAFIPTR